MDKQQRREKYPGLAMFKDDIQENFGKLAGLLIEDGKQINEWGETWGECVSFPADPMGMP